VRGPPRLPVELQARMRGKDSQSVWGFPRQPRRVFPYSKIGRELSLGSNDFLAIPTPHSSRVWHAIVIRLLATTAIAVFLVLYRSQERLCAPSTERLPKHEPKAAALLPADR